MIFLRLFRVISRWRPITVAITVAIFSLTPSAAPAEAAAQAHCSKMSNAAFKERLNGWAGKTLVAVSSWCTSCKVSLKAAAKRPQDYVFMVVFDDDQAVEAVLNRFALKSECISGANLAELLKIDELPWSRKLDVHGVLKKLSDESLDLSN
ncbi:MAG: hypothetical protein NTV34_08360 [Proteobacteria bacterium]|nr:hypothetical protein [Pseudomonadota bacterium]